MAFLQGYSDPIAYVPGSAQPGAYAQDSVAGGSPTTGMAAIIDGTPVRVAVIALSAAAGLVALHWAGFRFSLGVSA